jgi:hypothetical protein
MSKQEQQAAAEPTVGSMASSTDIEASTPPNVMQANVSQISLAQHPHTATQAWLRSILMHTDEDQVAAALRLAERESNKVIITDWRSTPDHRRTHPHVVHTHSPACTKAHAVYTHRCSLTTSGLASPGRS